MKGTFEFECCWCGEQGRCAFVAIDEHFPKPYGTEATGERFPGFPKGWAVLRLQPREVPPGDAVAYLCPGCSKEHRTKMERTWRKTLSGVEHQRGFLKAFGGEDLVLLADEKDG